MVAENIKGPHHGKELKKKIRKAKSKTFESSNQGAGTRKGREKVFGGEIGAKNLSRNGSCLRRVRGNGSIRVKHRYRCFGHFTVVRCPKNQPPKRDRWGKKNGGWGKGGVFVELSRHSQIGAEDRICKNFEREGG